MTTDSLTEATVSEMTFRIVKQESFGVVGVPQSSDTGGNYGEAWQQFELVKETIPCKAEENVGYGLLVYPPEGTNSDRFTYLASCEVMDLQTVPFGLFSTRVPEAEYAVFSVTNWYATLGKAWGAAYDTLSKSDYNRHGLLDFERYDTREFEKAPEDQEMEIWIPVTRK